MRRIVLYWFLLLLTVCNYSCLPESNGGRNVTTRTPINFYSQQVYVYAVKATDSNGRLLYRDTVSLLCNCNPLERLNCDKSSLKLHWLDLSVKSDRYIVNGMYGPSFAEGSPLPQIAGVGLFSPPRDYQYKVLELCPSPFLKYPMEVGEKWGWRKDADSSAYELVDKVPTDAAGATFACYRIHGVRTSLHGRSTADFFYDSDYGCVKLRYFLPDKKELVFSYIDALDSKLLIWH